MEWYAAAALLIGSIIGLMAFGIPVAFAFLLTNIMGVFVFSSGWSGLTQIVDNSTSLITTFTLAPIPMFILMGSLFFHTGLAIRVFDALDKLLGRIRGRLCYLTVIGGSLFSTLTGSTMANTAMLGSLLVPEMRRRGYSAHMSMGPILGTGGLAMIIPPSSLGVLLASIANIDVGRLLIAGLLPGVVLACLYGFIIFIQTRIFPDSTPNYDIPSSTLLEKLISVVVNILPMGLVVFMVVGFIILGLTTPTEAAAFGVLGVVILTIAFRCLTWSSIKTSMTGTIKTAGMVFFILMNSTVFSQLLALSGASSGMLEFATGLDLAPFTLLAMMFLILLALGMFMDQVSMMLITIPIFFPLAQTLGYDLIWFAIIVLIALEMSLTTPPFGLLLFIMIGVAPKGTTLPQVALAAAPFLFCDAILVGILVGFPVLALYLPGLMS
jgi:tripartite ATP-independent transporter DctM subunit